MFEGPVRNVPFYYGPVGIGQVDYSHTYYNDGSAGELPQYRIVVALRDLVSSQKSPNRLHTLQFPPQGPPRESLLMLAFCSSTFYL